MTIDHPYNFEFSHDGFVIKNRETGRIVAAGNWCGDLYALQPNEGIALFSTRFQNASDDVWHQRLGHPHMQVINHLKKNKLIISKDNNKVGSLCTSCQLGKACCLPFVLSDNFCDEPIAKIHCDLWGPAPVLSFQRFRYYVIFIDECTRFTWFFPLKNKSDFYDCFVKFHKYLQNQFDKRIRIFQSDGGREFSAHTF